MGDGYADFRALARCRCGDPLIILRPQHATLYFSELKIYRDTGKIVVRCQACNEMHVLDPGTSPSAPSPAASEFKQAVSLTLTSLTAVNKKAEPCPR